MLKSRVDSTEEPQTVNIKEEMLKSQVDLTEEPRWIDLPKDLTANILSRLGTEEILKTAWNVCTTWRSVCNEYPLMWRVIRLERNMFRDTLTMCHRVVDLSQGQLLDLDIREFGDDDLLRYISQRSSQLQCLRLVSCYSNTMISSQGLTEAAKKFSQLAELHLHYVPCGRDNIRAISCSCPLLKSFTLDKLVLDLMDYDRHDLSYNSDFDKEALAIAENMSNLCSLHLSHNDMTDVGLKAILARCLRLESLDMRGCYHVWLKGDLLNRCYRQIKEFKGPVDSTADDEFYIQFGDPLDYYDE